ncbi:MAG: 3-deoxy-manno-octulosonate cytidylyltransferase [Bacteriovoracia bacterium]
MKTLLVIPARYASTRLPGKPLADIHGKPMIQWVYEAAKKARGVDQVIVATDDDRVTQAVRKFGGEVMMTSPDLTSGTDRIAAVARQLKADIYINVQGDEPMIDPTGIEKALELVTSKRFTMASIMTPLRSQADLLSRNVVKVIVDNNSRALFFSRLPIPYGRQEPPAAPSGTTPYIPYKHLGLYVYTREVLFQISEARPVPLEVAESLEQLRAMQHGIPIGLAEVERDTVAVDTAEDLEKVRRLLV